MTKSLRLWCALAFGLLACEAPQEARDEQEKVDSSAFAIDGPGVMERLQRSFLAHEDRYWAQHPSLRVEVDDAGTIAVHPNEDIAPMLLTTTALGRGPILSEVAVRSDGGLSIERGEAVEHIDIVDEGLEQSWHFDEPPESASGLVVRVHVDGYAWDGESELGHHFVEPASGVDLVYGRATWIDADGERTDVDVRHDGNELVLAVPEEVVDESTFPAILDPVVFDPTPLIATVGAQQEPAAAFGAANYLAVWRHAAGDIRGALVNDGGGLPSTVSIAIAGGAAMQTQPDVAYDGTRFIVVWTQDGNIRGARVDTLGGVIGGVTFDIAVAADTQNAPSIACKQIGTCMVVWSDGRVPGNLEIRGRRLDAFGLPTGADFSVSSAALSHEVAPDIVFAESNYFVVWQDQRVDADVYGSRVTDLGVALEPNGIAIGTANLAQAPQLAAIGKTVLVGWSEKVLATDATWSVRARRVDAATSVLLDAAPLDAAGAASSTGTRPSVANTDSAFAVAWNEGTQLAGRRMGTDGIWDDPAPLDLHSPETVGQSRTGLASDGVRYLLLWDDVREPSAGIDIWCAGLSDALARLFDDDTLVTPTVGALSQHHPSIAWNGTHYLVVWEDLRRGNRDIMAATIDHLGSLTNPVNAVAHTNSAETTPDVAWGGGSWLVSWAHNDVAAGGNDVYAVRVGTDADPIGSPVAISTAMANQQAPAVAYDGTNFVVAFEDNAAGTYDIRAARLDTNATLLDPGGVVVASGPIVQQDPDIAAAGGQTFIVWRHDIFTLMPIARLYGTTFSSAGVVLVPGGVNLTEPGNDPQDQPAIASHGGNEVLVVWRQANRIRGRKFNLNAIPTAVAFNIGTGVPAESFPVVTSDGLHWAVAWRDAGGAGDIRGELLHDHGVAFLGDYSIAVTAAAEGQPAIAAAAPGVLMSVFQGAAPGGTAVQGTLLANDCCAGIPPQPNPGCSDLEVLDCVCDGDAWCCTSGWDDACREAAIMCGAVCP